MLMLTALHLRSREGGQRNAPELLQNQISGSGRIRCLRRCLPTHSRNLVILLYVNQLSCGHCHKTVWGQKCLLYLPVLSTTSGGIGKG